MAAGKLRPQRRAARLIRHYERLIVSLLEPLGAAARHQDLDEDAEDYKELRYGAAALMRDQSAGGLAGSSPNRVRRSQTKVLP